MLNILYGEKKAQSGFYMFQPVKVYYVNPRTNEPETDWYRGVILDIGVVNNYKFIYVVMPTLIKEPCLYIVTREELLRTDIPETQNEKYVYCPVCHAKELAHTFYTPGVSISCTKCGLTGPSGTDSDTAQILWNSINLTKVLLELKANGVWQDTVKHADKNTVWWSDIHLNTWRDK